LLGPSILSVASVLMSASLVYLGNGLLGMVLPITGTQEGFSTILLGLMGSAFSVGFVGGCLFGPVIVRRVGHIRSLAVFAALASSTALAYALLVHPVFWMLLRLFSGLSIAALFLVMESWLSEKADPAARGRIMGAYMLVNFTSVVSGQLLVGVADAGQFELFAMASILLTIALIPVGLTKAMGPAPIHRVQIRLGHLYAISPVGVVGALIVGVTVGAFGALAAVLATNMGFSAFETAVFVSASLAGAALLQMPAGALSDRIDRRMVIAGMAVLASAAGLAMALSRAETGPAVFVAGLLGADPFYGWLVLAFLFGAVALPIQGVAMAHLNDRVDDDGFVEAASGFQMLWGAGAATGPFLAGAAMAMLDDNALFLMTAIAHGALAAYALLRIRRRVAVVPDDKADYVVSSLTSTTHESLQLDPRAEG